MKLTHAPRRLTLAGLVLLATSCGVAPFPTDSTTEPFPLIVDTDAGIDDLMALAFLLASPGVRLEAITVGTGLARVEPGAHNVLRLLDLAGRPDIPVFLGRPTPLAGERAFPESWRDLTDALPGVDLPTTARGPEARPAAKFLAERLSDASRPVDVLALGGLTNIAEALDASENGAAAVRKLVIMGGAVDVPGNLHEAGENENVTAEWNFHIDAEAARRVFASGVPIRLIPLDATDRVPLDRSYIAALRGADHAPLARMVVQLLEIVVEFMDAGNYYAWDPLAAVTLVDSTVVTLRPAAVAIRLDPPEDGRSVAEAGGAPNALVAFDADARRFRHWFLRVLAEQP
jgi:inosine-uridine nucleoside N-ribohydrolase